ncbi:hypothetical protein [Bdellovibrio sp. HCB288]|uniref:hypothetical protein n=1 Tax=Bdellovibrio sp. HCB288 TaxID=3394355 RepID=UPI0039B5959B
MDTPKLTPADSLNQKKATHDYLASAIQILTTRVQFFHEEFEGVYTLVNFLRNFKAQVLAEIHEIEPPKEGEVQKPYLMDLSHVKGEGKE